jgi:hypothetical protein
MRIIRPRSPSLRPFFPGWQKSLEAAGIDPFGLALITQNPQLLGESGVKGAVPATFAILVFFESLDEIPLRGASYLYKKYRSSSLTR